MQLTKRLRGIIPPLVTPLRARDELDVAGLERLLEHVLDGGVSGVFILGSTGEGPSLSYRLRCELIQRTCRQVAGRALVLVGVTDTAIIESLTVARWAADAGADAVVAAPPYYLSASQADLQQYFDHLASELPLPLVLYNMPALTHVSIEPETVRRAMDHPRVFGLKDSSGSMGYLHQVLRLRGPRTDWPILVGEEETLAYAVQAGADGGVNGGANMFPKLYTQFFTAAEQGDTTRVGQLLSLVVRVGELYRVGRRNTGGCIQSIKCVLAMLGLCDDFLAEPLHRFRDPERARVRQLLEGLLDEVNEATGDRTATKQGVVS